MQKLLAILLIGVVNTKLLLFIKRLYGFETSMLVGVLMILTYLVILNMEIENK